MEQHTVAKGLPGLPCACATLRRASRAVTQLYEAELRPMGLRATQFTVLQALARVGPVTQTRLGEMLVIDSTTLTRTLNLLRKKGWVRTVPGEDRRERHHELTRSGRKLCERAFRAWERAQERLRGKLGSSDWQALQSVLGRITRAALDA